jgi:hypothetical protein
LEAIIDDKDLVCLAVPFADQARAGPEDDSSQSAEIRLFCHCPRQLIELALVGGAEPAEFALLQLPSYTKHEQFASELLGWMGSIKAAPFT